MENLFLPQKYCCLPIQTLVKFSPYTVMDCRERARSGCEAAARDGQGGFEGVRRSDAAVVSCRERARNGHEAATRDAQGGRGLEDV
jgi:hypothetical protein